MNLLDLAILLVLGVSILFGLHSGFLTALLNTVGLVVSWVCAFLGYSSLSAYLVENTNLFELIVHFTEGSSHLTSYEAAHTNVATVTPGFVQSIVGEASLPAPFDKMVTDNILGQVFAAEGAQTLADYFNNTVAYAALNIMSFLIILAAGYLIFSILCAIVNYVVHLPVLRQFDSLAGGVFGLVRGVLILFALFTLVPVALSVVQIDFVTELLETSALAPYFYDKNFLLNAIQSFL